MKGPLFYSKILLFGEYGIIKDSKGLSIPFSLFNGALKIDGDVSDAAKASNQSLKKFVEYLGSLKIQELDFDFENYKLMLIMECILILQFLKAMVLGVVVFLVAAIYI